MTAPAPLTEASALAAWQDVRVRQRQHMKLCGLCTPLVAVCITGGILAQDERRAYALVRRARGAQP